MEEEEINGGSEKLFLRRVPLRITVRNIIWNSDVEPYCSS